MLTVILVQTREKREQILNKQEGESLIKLILHLTLEGDSVIEKRVQSLEERLIKLEEEKKEEKK